MVKRNSFKLIFLSTIFVVLLTFIDQITKIMAVDALSDGSTIDVIPGVLVLYYIKNTGAAFSFLSGKPVFFIIITPFIVGFIIHLFLKIPKTRRFYPLIICLLFIIAGAFGNFIDRILFRYVRDFIYFKIIDFPVFNVADIYVTCSVFVLAFLCIFFYKSDELDGVLF